MTGTPKHTAPTGEQLAGAIRARAAQLGVPIWQFASPLSAQPIRWLHQLSQARFPKPHTVARVNALLAGDAVIAPPKNNFQASQRSTPLLGAERRLADEAAIDRVTRDPCISCGVRADRHDDFGCRRFQRSGLAA